MVNANTRNLAAQYLRVSSEHQRYSIDCQREYIERHAVEHGIKIVKTYIDRAKSGVSLRDRSGLKQLLADVTGGQAAYGMVLVYDISRWGRFQDIDEAGHYEFLCKQSGIPVHYCAELFEEDGSASTSIMKVLKRSMAAEYSRELGERSFVGQGRIVQRGFKAGGAAGYGYRRLLLSADGSPKQELALGERKSVSTDRVVLTLGPASEVKCVRLIYRLVVEQNMSFSAIARELNNSPYPHPSSTPWTHHRVRAILTNLKYKGTAVYGRVSRRLHTPEVKKPKDSWIVVPKAFPPVVTEDMYAAAERAMATRTIRKTNDQLLAELRSILAVYGKLSAKLIRLTKAATPAGSYRTRFGNLERAYELAGYQMPGARNVRTRSQLQQVQSRLVQNLRDLFPDRVSVIGKLRQRSRLRIDHEDTVIVRACCCGSTKRGESRWRIRSEASDAHSVRLLALMDSRNEAISRCVLLPPMFLPKTLDVSVNSRLIKTGRQILDPSRFLDLWGSLKQVDCTGVAFRDPRFLRSPLL